MTRDEWLNEGRELVDMGRRLKIYRGLLIANDESYRFMWRQWRWRRRGQRNGWWM